MAPTKKTKNVGRPISTPIGRHIIGSHSKSHVALGSSSKTKNTMAAISTITTAHTTTEPTPTPTILPAAPVVTQPPPLPSPVVPPSQPTKVGSLIFLSQGSYWAWKVRKFDKFGFQAWEVTEFYVGKYNNKKSIYIAPWFQVTLFKGAVTSKKKLKVKI